MPVKIITSAHTLMQLAAAVGRAKKAGDPAAIEEAEKKLREYEEIVKMSDGMSLGFTRGDLGL